MLRTRCDVEMLSVLLRQNCLVNFKQDKRLFNRLSSSRDVNASEWTAKKKKGKPIDVLNENPFQNIESTSHPSKYAPLYLTYVSMFNV